MRLVLICALSILSFIAQGQGIINYIAKYSFEANFNDSTTTYNGAGNATISSVQFHDGASSAVFDGGNDSIGLGLISFNDAFSMSFWAYVPIGTTDSRVFITNSASGTDEDGFRMYTNEYLGSERNINFNAGNGASSDNITTANSALTFGQWNHIVFSYDSTTDKGRIYINNVRADGDSATTVNFKRNARVRLGLASDNGLDFFGYLDEICFYNFVVTASQVDSLYNGYYPSGEGSPPQLPQTAYLHYVGADEWRNYKSDNLYAHFINSQTAGFTIYEYWDFESETLGDYTYAEIIEDFEEYDLFDHSAVYITKDEINGDTTQVVGAEHTAGVLYDGLQLNAYFDASHTEYDEIYISYNQKFSDDWNSTAGGKLSGLRGLPPTQAPIAPDNGFYAAPHFKSAGRFISYHYDRTYGTAGDAWSYEPYDYNVVYFNNNQWYNITQRIVKNTFTGGVANADGINEIWVDGKLIFQESNLKYLVDETKGIDAFFLGNYYGGSGFDYTPQSDCDAYIDNVTIWMPKGDAVNGQELHSTTALLATPYEITDKTVNPDSTRTTEGVLSNTAYTYGENYSPCIDETFLIDAGVGKTVTYEITDGVIGGGDYVYFYGGNQSNSELITIIEGYDATINQIISSPTRYMFIRFSSNTDGGVDGFTGTITFNENYTIYNEWNFNDESLGDYSSEISNDFDVLEMYWEENTDIVNDTIDGVESKALKVTQASGVMDQGLQLDAALGQDFDEVYMTYNIKFGSNWAWLEGKLPGLEGQPFPTINFPAEVDDGFIAIKLFKEGGRLTTFNYDHSDDCAYGACATEIYNTDNAVYFMNNTWYDVTQRLVMNTFTGGSPNADGLNEVWINGVKVYEEANKTYFEQELGGIDAFAIAMFYSNTGSEPNAETYSIIDNIKIYTPNNDATLGTNTPHDNTDTITTPNTITDQTIVYDSLRSTTGTLRNSEYGSNYSNEIEEVYLIDAGAGNTVTYTFNAGNVTGDDFIIIRDGNKSVSDVLYRVSDANPTGNYTSTGRYMSIQFTTQGNAVSTGFTGTITFN